MVAGGDNEDAATEERISQILSEAQAAMQKKHSDEQVTFCAWPLYSAALDKGVEYCDEFVCLSVCWQYVALVVAL